MTSADPPTAPPPTLTWPPTWSPLDLTDDQARAVYARIEAIDAHMDACCAFQLDACRYGPDLNRAYDVLHLAGLPEHVTLDRRADLEAWLDDRRRRRRRARPTDDPDGEARS